MSGKRRSYGGTTGVRSFLFERPPARHVGMPKAFAWPPMEIHGSNLGTSNLPNLYNLLSCTDCYL